MKVLVTGDREWIRADIIFDVLKRLTAVVIVTKIIHGDCRGADSMVDSIAKKMGLTVHPYPADWQKHFKAAGPIRNQQMLDSEHPELVLAFHDNIATSRGTRDMVNRALKAGIPVILIDTSGVPRRIQELVK